MINIEALRSLYDYHFALYRRIWDECISALSEEQFTQPLDYSIGAIRNQCVHVIDVETVWFSRLAGTERPASLEYAAFPDHASVRKAWDALETRMRELLAKMDDSSLSHMIRYNTRRIGPAENPAWEILLHVINHGTDHRAQILAMLHSLGAPTLEQDLMLYLFTKRLQG